jgi:hypothetical protein
MTDQTLTFFGWTRERIAGLAGSVSGGRPSGTTQLTLTGTDAGGAPTGSSTGTLAFALAGPGDVLGLAPGAISRRYPTPGATDHESDRCPLVEFADPALPWRYTPGAKPAAGTGAIHPWLVLVVGTEGDELTLTADRVGLAADVQQLHPIGAPTTAARWAHVQADGAGHRIGRVLSGRALSPGTDYLAVLVPAYRADGSPCWTGAGPALVPVYDHWRFRTAVPAGSFEELAAALRPGDAPSTTGRAPLSYPRLPAATLEVRGALGPIDAADAALPAEIGTDLAGLRTPATDEVGRPIVGLPSYGTSWRDGADSATTWGASLNGDPRHRGVAGLGLELGIRLQDDLVAEATSQVGALAEARQKISHLVLGLAASTGLWQRRLPTDAHEQLWLMGPALGRVVTESGTVAALSTAADRALPRGVWSSAARRVLRSGPSRTAATTAGTVAARPVLAAANTPPPGPQPAQDGVVLTGAFDQLLATTVVHGVPAPAALQGLAVQAGALAAASPGPIQQTAREVAGLVNTAAKTTQPAPYAEAMLLLVSGASATRAAQLSEAGAALSALRGRFGTQPPAAKDALAALAGLGPAAPPAEPPCAAVDLDALTTGVVAAFDPSPETAAMRTRVLSQVGGLDPAQPLAPPEACVGIDRPVWRDVDAAFADWLLPGVGALDDNAVIALETDPEFVEALLVGLNTQLLGELRWRNIPVATGCTPLRAFWQRANATDGSRVDDILGITTWPADTDLGDPAHRPPGAGGRDLVIAVRGRLFLRYPATVVYLTAAAGFDADPAPDAARVLPTFQGRIGPDVSFFGFDGFDPDAIGGYWLVFEEPPAGYRFANDASTATAPEQWATAAFAPPVRVLIRGDRLIPGSANA